jgi:hypothetical protein
MYFPFHLFIRWFASASNILTTLSLAINLARLEEGCKAGSPVERKTQEKDQEEGHPDDFVN